MDMSKVSASDLETLKHLSDLLHLFHHRNKNQHRRSIWWRHFTVFRRQLNLLVGEITSLHEVPSTHLARSQKKAKDTATNDRVEQRLLFWQNDALPKWQRAFSQIVADGRFAVLGLVLLAVVAQVCQITGITSELENVGHVEMEKVLEKFGREDWHLDAAPLTGKVDRSEEDQGEVVQRDEDVSTIGLPANEKERKNVAAVDATNPLLSKEQPRPTPEKRQKKKRRKGNAIDDLFSGLG